MNTTPEDAKPASFVNIAFDSGRLYERVQIIQELKAQACTTPGCQAGWCQSLDHVITQLENRHTTKGNTK